MRSLRSLMNMVDNTWGEEQAEAREYCDTDGDAPILEGLALYIDADYGPNHLGFLLEVQPHLAEDLIVQQIGSMKCCFSFGTRQWTVPAGDKSIIYEELDGPTLIYTHGERNYRAEVMYYMDRARRYEPTDDCVCENCGNKYKVPSVVIGMLSEGAKPLS